MNKDEVLELALDWLVCYKDKSMSRNNADDLAEELITAIKQARSAPEEPVGVFREDNDIGHVDLIPHQQMKLKDGDLVYAAPPKAPVQEPVGTYGEIFESMLSLLRTGLQGDQQIYMAMKDKPLYATPPAAPVQEPMAWLIPGSITTDPELAKANGDKAVALGKISTQQWNPEDHYADGWRDAMESVKRATPPAAPVQEFLITDEKGRPMTFWGGKATSPAAQRQWVGLTDVQMDDIYYCVEGGASELETWREHARAIEAKLKEKNT